MKKTLLASLCVIWFAGCLSDSGIIRLKPEIVGLEKTGASEVRSTVPRAILLVHAVERKEIGSDENRTVFYIYDPAIPGQNFQKVFSGPGEGQNVGFITPLFGWCGLVRGIVDSHNPVDYHPPYVDIFWYNLLTGEKGNWPGNALAGKAPTGAA